MSKNGMQTFLDTLDRAVDAAKHGGDYTVSFGPGFEDFTIGKTYQATPPISLGWLAVAAVSGVLLGLLLSGG